MSRVMMIESFRFLVLRAGFVFTFEVRFRLARRRTGTRTQHAERAALGTKNAERLLASPSETEEHVSAGANREGGRDGQDPRPDDLAGDAPPDRREPPRRAHTDD